MNSKQTVSDVLNIRTPKYVPLGTYLIDCDTVERVIGHETYVRNRIKTQLALWAGRRNEVVQSLKEDTTILFKRLPCIDIIIPQKEAQILPPADYIPPRITKINDSTWKDDKGTIYRSSYISNDITIIDRPPVKDDFLQPKPPDPSIFEAYNHLISMMRDEKFVAGVSGGFNIMPLPGGMESGLMAYIEDPDRMKRIIKHTVDTENYLDDYYIRDDIDAVFVEYDTGTTLSSIMSPNMFREFCYLAMKERIDHIKHYHNKVLFHSCGNTWNLFDMFVDAGVDGYQSLQTGAGMDLDKLKKVYGNRVCFWGGVSVEVLLTGSMDDVRNNVRAAMEAGKPNGGFILGPSHSIAFGVPYDNFLTLLDEHDKLKWYV